VSKDHEWIRTHLEKLVKEHAGNYVLVLDGKVIAADKSGVRVREKAKREFPDKNHRFFAFPERSILTASYRI